MAQLGDELLIAYSDGELSTRQREEVGFVLDYDPVTALRLKKLQNTRNRLALLFEDILGDHDRLKVENLIDLPQGVLHSDLETNALKSFNDVREEQVDAPATPVVKPAQQKKISQVSSQPVRSQLIQPDYPKNSHQGAFDAKKGSNTVSKGMGEGENKRSVSKIVMNLVTSSVILTAGLAAGYFYQGYHNQNNSTELVPNLYAPVVNGGWTTAVIHHHSLLRRETVESGKINQKNIALIKNQLNSALGMKVTIPDLTSHGLTFARAQILTHNNNKIAQITYLPVQGAPVSLYIRKENKQASLNNGSLGDVNMVHWAQGREGFVLAGKLPHWQLIVISVNVRRSFGTKLASK